MRGEAGQLGVVGAGAHGELEDPERVVEAVVEQGLLRAPFEQGSAQGASGAPPTSR